MATHRQRARVSSAIVCDEARREATGKLLIVGAYDAAMLIEKFPFDGRISLVLLVEILEPGPSVIEVELSYPGADGKRRKIVVKAEGESADEPAKLEMAMMEIPYLPFHIFAPGEIQISARVDEGEWSLVRTVRAVLVVHEQATTTASEQPSSQSPPASQETGP